VTIKQINKNRFKQLTEDRAQSDTAIIVTIHILVKGPKFISSHSIFFLLLIFAYYFFDFFVFSFVFFLYPLTLYLYPIGFHE